MRHGLRHLFERVPEGMNYETILSEAMIYIAMIRLMVRRLA